MRAPSNLIAEGVAYIVIGLLAGLVIAHAATAPGEPRSPDMLVAEAR
jgi:hypothetical protein